MDSISGTNSKSVKVTTRRSKEEGFRLNNNELYSVLCQEAIAETPVVIIGIAGCLRSGKSFLISFLTRYLRNRGWHNPRWIGDDETQANEGVEWRGGRRPHTEGIVIWNEVFMVENENGEELAVLLLDTQGLFDQKMTKEDNTRLFTLTVFLCSLLMLNIKGQIDERELESLEFFVEYAKAAATEGNNLRTFQDLLFLVRDWVHEEDNAFGIDGGREYLKEMLECVEESSLNNVRENVRDGFRNIDCFLMPLPGPKVVKNGFTGKNGDIDEAFLSNVKDLSTWIFGSQRLAVKTHEGKVMTGRGLWNLLRDCDEAFGNVKTLSVENIMPAMAKARNRIAYEEGLKMYKEYMKKNCVGAEGSEVDEIHSKAQQNALDHFENETKFGGEKYRGSFRHHLIEDCLFTLNEFADWNELRKTEARNYSSEKVHELWTIYKSDMKEGTDSKFQEEKKLVEMHEKNKAKALRSYESETAVKAAYMKEHVQLLEKYIDHTFKKLKRINGDWETLEMLGKQKDCEKDYEAFLLLHALSQQYREEFEKFTAMYVEEDKLENQNNELKESYYKLFENNWSSNDVNIDQYRARFVEILHEECEDARTVNMRNKEVYESNIEERVTNAKVSYSELMGKVVRDCYAKPGDLDKVSDVAKGKVMETLTKELSEVDPAMKHDALVKAERSMDDTFPRIQEQNKGHEDIKPPFDFQQLIDMIQKGAKILVSLVILIRRFMPIINMIRSAAGAMVPSVTLMSSGEAAASAVAIPSATAVAAGAGVVAAVTGVAVVAYCVYKHYDQKNKAIEYEK